MQKRDKIDKSFYLTMERKYSIENTAPLLNANLENSAIISQWMHLLQKSLLCTHCNRSVTLHYISCANYVFYQNVFCGGISMSFKHILASNGHSALTATFH
jgi:hypothetical protein